MQLSLSHLGYLPASPKKLTFLAAEANGLPDSIPFYLRQNCLRLPREDQDTGGFSARFPSPYDLMRGKLVTRDGPAILFHGQMHKIATRWGAMWQADFSHFQTPGSYQIETDWQISPPFAIREGIYERILAGYLNFLRAQRCGFAVFGVHEACHLDDGVLDTDGTAWRATGGWHDAGDFRKWLAFTLYHVDALITMREQVSEKLERGNVSPGVLLDEIAWGNSFFHAMVNAQGQVYEDVAGGNAPEREATGCALSYPRHWWFENHPGGSADAADNRWTDNIAGSGDERKVRTTYNPLVQWAFVQVEARAAKHLPAAPGQQCLQLALRAARFARECGHDRRTLFVAAELRGNLELLAAGDASVDLGAVLRTATELLGRQAQTREGLSGYFMEAGARDGYRSVAFAADPPLTLLRLWELRTLLKDEEIATQARQAVVDYIESYLLVDCRSNPFGLTPYGVYCEQPYRDRQVFREAGADRGVRTFMHPFNSTGMVHGTSSVLMSHAHLLAKAGVLLGNANWGSAAERLLQWCLGHNTLNRSLFTGIGYRQPIGYSFRIPQLPEAMVVGFIGKPDDSPYLEESMAIEWNTLEYWSVPFVHAAQAVCWLQA